MARDLSTADPLDLFPCTNGVFDTMAKGVPFRPGHSDRWRFTTGWEYSTEEARAKHHDVKAFLERVLPVADERDFVLTYLANLMNGNRLLGLFMAFDTRGQGIHPTYYKRARGTSSLLLLIRGLFGDLAADPVSDYDEDFHWNSSEDDEPRESYINERYLKDYRFLGERMKRALIGSGVQEYLIEELTKPKVKIGGCKLTAGLILSSPGSVFDKYNEWQGVSDRLIVVKSRSQFVDREDSTPCSVEAHIYPEEDYATFSTVAMSWNSAFLDILREHYDPTNCRLLNIPPSMMSTGARRTWAAKIVQSAFRGWLVRKTYRFSPHNGLGRHIIARMFASE